jgi:hypothetical protein
LELLFLCLYYWGHGKLGRCVIQLSKFLNHTLATHNQVDSFFENINYNDGKGAFTLTLFEMTITDCPGFHVPHCNQESEQIKHLLTKRRNCVLLQARTINNERRSYFSNNLFVDLELESFL